MRLQEREKEAIKECFAETFKTGRIYFFGSRIAGTQKGGDIDLYIDTYDKDRLYDKKI